MMSQWMRRQLLKRWGLSRRAGDGKGPPGGVGRAIGSAMINVVPGRTGGDENNTCCEGGNCSRQVEERVRLRSSLGMIGGG